jgi:hypothetical protein
MNVPSNPSVLLHRVLLFMGTCIIKLQAIVALISEQQWHEHGAQNQELLSKWQVDNFLKFQQL